MKTDALIAHLSQFHPKGYDLSLGRVTELLKKLDNPHLFLPEVFHVAGTNGKGSIVANLRSILEAGGFSAHAHTSPHLVNAHERYRIGDRETGGKIVNDDMLADALGRVADANDGAKITVFELLAASMFVLFSEQPADYAIIEVGLGGRFDSTNVIEAPLVSVISTISIDHQSYLGDTIEKIAFEKAGIIKPGGRVVIGPQCDDARRVLEKIALEKKCPMIIAGQDFDFYEEAGRFIYQDENGLLDLPLPSLKGEHQLANSATAIAATRFAQCDISHQAYEAAMENIYWPGRLEQLPRGTISEQFGDDAEIWIDGGHNAGAGAVIAREFAALNARNSKPLVMISAMLNSKDPKAYFLNFQSLEPTLLTVPVAGTEHGIDAEDLANHARNAGVDATSCNSLEQALSQIANFQHEFRLLISGTLYLVGEVLKKNGTPPK